MTYLNVCSFLKKTMEILINKQKFTVKSTEYNKIYIEEFCNLNMLEGLGEQERLISLLRELSLCSDDIKPNLIYSAITHGGYVPIQLSPSFNVIEGIVESKEDFINLEINRKRYDVDNITVFDKVVWQMIIREDNIPYIAFISKSSLDLENNNNPIFIVTDNRDVPCLSSFSEYWLSYSNYRVLVHEKILDKFKSHFKFFLNDENNNNVLDYDNLLHLTMIIKNGGDSLESVLRQNLPFFDEYTILDTGSTDNTVQVLKEVLKNKKGKIYEEPFINFRDSRNRCLDLAGKNCKFIIMLDDTYILQNNLRGFLQTVRGDQFSDSFSLYIKSDDVEYGSNRIIKSESGLRYIYKMHEVITPENNMNVIIPLHHGHIFDYRSDYMEERTMTRKEYDLKILYEMVDDDPDDSRAYYYLGQTYNLLHNHEKAFENFLKRVEHPHEGFIQEKIDACFESARIANFYLNKPWKECEQLYLRAYEMDKSRPDSLYFVGIHYYLDKEFEIAYQYFKQAYIIGYPIHCQYSLKPTLSYYFLPKFLTEVCYYVKDYALGKEVSAFFIEKNQDEKSPVFDKTHSYTVKCWNKIYSELTLQLSRPVLQIIKEKKLIVVFIVNGGFTQWKGSDITKQGVGGSETFIIEITRYMERHSNFHCVVFCNCGNEGEIFEGVEYKPLYDYVDYIASHEIHSVIVSRYPEYLPACYESHNVSNVYLILHDLIPDGEIIMRHPKLKKILLLSDYHKHFFDRMFPSLVDLTEKFEYGIDINAFKEEIAVPKVPYKFIYSSFANRGLLYILQMWKRIKGKFPTAELHIHCDVENPWLNSVDSQMMHSIKSLLFSLKDEGIVYKGWTSKKELYETWKTADVWFYPTTFLETFCLTALEAALSKTLAVTFPIGSLVETVGNRGLLINRNVLTPEGQEDILQNLFWILDEKNWIVKDDYIQRNYQWAIEKSWSRRSDDFVKLIGGSSSSSKEPLLPTIIQYYTSFMNRKVNNVLLYGNCESIDESIFGSHSTIYNETDDLRLMSYIKSKTIFNFLYLDEVKDSMVVTLCYDMLMESGSIMRLPLKTFDLLNTTFTNFTILERDDREIYIEKI